MRPMTTPTGGRPSLLMWLGRPIGRRQRDDDNDRFLQIGASHAARGMADSGMRRKAEDDFRYYSARRRSTNRAIAVVFVALVAVAFASSFTDNRVVDGLGRALPAAASLAAVLGLVVQSQRRE